MESWVSAISALVGIGLGAGACWLFGRGTLARLTSEIQAFKFIESARVDELGEARRTAESWRAKHESEYANRARFEAEARRLVGLEVNLDQARVRIETIGNSNAALQAQLQEQARAHDEKIAILTAVRGEIGKDLKSITADALSANQNTFLQLANEVFEKHKTGAGADWEARQMAVEALVSPLRETLQTYKQQVDEMEKARSHAYGALSVELKGVAETQHAVRAETSKLVNALRAAPKTRGRWGEHSLRNVLELSGLNSYCDFSTEESFSRDGSVSRPDAIIRLPGGRNIVVDAKTSLSAYLDAVDAIDDSERDRFLKQHAAQIRLHAKQLAGKAYWDGLTVTPDFVVMFVPGDNFYAAALEHDSSLFEDAAEQRVIIVTPATLIALAKTVAFGWRQEKVAENAQRVHALGREIYRRMITMTTHIDHCGESLGKAVTYFNQFVGSLEHSVMPQARRFNELEVEGTAAEIPILEPIEIEPRLLRADRDFAEAADTQERLPSLALG